MSKTVKVTYNANILETTIVVDGRDFDTSHINGKEVENWVYPFILFFSNWLTFQLCNGIIIHRKLI